MAIKQKFQCDVCGEQVESVKYKLEMTQWDTERCGSNYHEEEDVCKSCAAKLKAAVIKTRNKLRNNNGREEAD